MLIQSTKDIHEGPIKMVIYGQAGFGKTYLAKTLPHDEVLIISAESGLRTLDETDIQYVDISTDDKGAALVGLKKIERLKDVMRYVKTEEASKKFKTIIVDSITEIGEVVLSVYKQKFPSKAQSFDLWGGFGDEMVAFIKELRDLPNYNVVILALEDLDKDDSQRFFYGPSLPGKTPREFLIPAYDIILRLVKEKDNSRYLMTSGDVQIKAKDRTGKLAEKEIPDLGYLFGKIKFKKQEKKEEIKK